MRTATALAAGVVVLAALACVVGVLPANPDLYLHLLWTQQVMRCLAAGSPPLWLPDLNAGFGSPGLRLASPLGPLLDGVLGLALRDASRGLRLGALLAAAGVFLAYAARRDRTTVARAVLVLLSPAAVHALLGRSAWSEVLALPLLVWLLEAAVAGWAHPGRDGVLVGALWLLHAPSTLELVVVALLAQVLRGDIRALARVALSTVAAAGLTAWHWLPLLDEAGLVGTRAALTGGIYDAARNLLGSSGAHALETNIALGWCAVGLLLVLIVLRSWRSAPVRTALVVVSVAAASPLALPLWRLSGPLALLQFPWRLLLPATVLAAPLIADSLADWRGRLAAVALLLPLLALPLPRLVNVPPLRAGMSWQEVGLVVHEAIGGNPLLVDAVQHRPPSFAALAGNLARFAADPVRVLAGTARWRVERWAPLDRVLTVRASGDAVVALRLLEYPGWVVRVDGAPRAAVAGSGVMAVTVPSGEHRVTVRWRGNPLTPVGFSAAVVSALLLLAAPRWWRGRGSSAA
jgi:hypothetical protein